MATKSVGQAAVVLAWVLGFALIGGCEKAPEETAEETPPAVAESPAPANAPAPMAAPGQFAGTIDASGYHPPAGASVIWQRPGATSVTKSLNPAVPWSGQNAGDDPGYFGRYAGGDTSVRGAQIAAIGSEQKGGEASAILTQLLGRPPSNQELVDFATSNSPGAPMGCSAWVAITGSPREGCADTGGTGSDGLRLRPNTPPGCCATTNRCIVNDPVRDVNRQVGEKWTEPVLDGARRIGCNLIKGGGGPQPTPTPGPTPTPTPARPRRRVRTPATSFGCGHPERRR